MDGTFSLVKRGYNPQEVDEYIATLQQVIKSYKSKDNAIKNAIISAQVAADNILKNAHAESEDYRSQTQLLLKNVLAAINVQREQVHRFQEEYNAMLHKYLHPMVEADFTAIHESLNALENYLRQANIIEPEASAAPQMTPPAAHYAAAPGYTAPPEAAPQHAHPTAPPAQHTAPTQPAADVYPTPAIFPFPEQ